MVIELTLITVVVTENNVDNYTEYVRKIRHLMITIITFPLRMIISRFILRENGDTSLNYDNLQVMIVGS